MKSLFNKFFSWFTPEVVITIPGPTMEEYITTSAEPIISGDLLVFLFFDDKWAPGMVAGIEGFIVNFQGERWKVIEVDLDNKHVLCEHVLPN